MTILRGFKFEVQLVLQIKVSQNKKKNLKHGNKFERELCSLPKETKMANIFHAKGGTN
jgi:hypothetical protein